MLTKTKEKHIEWIMTHPEQKITISGLSTETGTAYALTYNNVQDLVKEQIFATYSVPPAQVIMLHPKAPTEVLFTIEMKRRQKFFKKYVWAELMVNDILQYTNDPFFILVIFCSYAKGIPTPKSDIDLLVIVPSKEKALFFEHAILKVYTKIKKEVIVVKTSEFEEMIKKSNELNVGNEAKKHHILLHGAEQWYALVKDTI